MTSFVLHIPNVPALFKALGGCATNGVTRTRLEAKWWPSASTIFMVDAEGHPSNLPLCLALEELEFLPEVPILGVYAAAEFRTAKTVTA